MFEPELAAVGTTAEVGVGLVDARSTIDEFAPDNPPPYTPSPPVSTDSVVASRLLDAVIPPPKSFSPLLVRLKLFASTPPPPPLPLDPSFAGLAGETDGLLELAMLTWLLRLNARTIYSEICRPSSSPSLSSAVAHSSRTSSVVGRFRAPLTPLRPDPDLGFNERAAREPRRDEWAEDVVEEATDPRRRGEEKDPATGCSTAVQEGAQVEED